MLLWCTYKHINTLYSCFAQTLIVRATFLLNVIISLCVIVGQIQWSAELGPVVRCYAALSHTWLYSPLVLSFHPQHLSSISTSTSTFSNFLPISKHSSTLAYCILTCSSPLTLWQSPPPSPPLCSSSGSSGSTACRKLRALDLTVCLVSSFDRNHSKLRTQRRPWYFSLSNCCRGLWDSLVAISFFVVPDVNMHIKHAAFLCL